MARRLITVEDTFQIAGRGLIPAPGILPLDQEVIKIGDPLQLRRPDGVVFLTKIAGIEMIGVSRKDICILLKGLDKDQVPIGTEIWSVDETN
jgi:hypothetical protein